MLTRIKLQELARTAGFPQVAAVLAVPSAEADQLVLTINQTLRFRLPSVPKQKGLTGTNVSVLGNEIQDHGMVRKKVESTHYDHLRRCLAAGLFDGKTGELTPLGRDALGIDGMVVSAVPSKSYSLDYDPRAEVAKWKQADEERAEAKRMKERDERALAVVKTVKQLDAMMRDDSDMHRPFPYLERSAIRQRREELKKAEDAAEEDRLRYKADALVPRYVVQRRYTGGGYTRPSSGWRAVRFLPFEERDRRLVEIAENWGTQFTMPKSKTLRGSPDQWPPDPVWEKAAEKPSTLLQLTYMNNKPLWAVTQSRYSGTSDQILLWADGTRVLRPASKELIYPEDVFLEIDGDSVGYSPPGLPLK